MASNFKEAKKISEANQEKNVVIIPDQIVQALNEYATFYNQKIESLRSEQNEKVALILNTFKIAKELNGTWELSKDFTKFNKVDKANK